MHFFIGLTAAVQSTRNMPGWKIYAKGEIEQMKLRFQEVVKEKSQHVDGLKQSLLKCEAHFNQSERAEAIQASLQHNQILLVIVSAVAAVVILGLLALAFSMFRASCSARKTLEAETCKYEGLVTEKQSRIQELERRVLDLEQRNIIGGGNSKAVDMLGQLSLASQLSQVSTPQVVYTVGSPSPSPSRVYDATGSSSSVNLN